MAKPEWGQKRICTTCSAHFYDLRRSPIHCPKCNAVFDPEAVLKARRARNPSPKVVEVAKPRPEPEVPLPSDEEVEDEVGAQVEDEEEAPEKTVIEDTSDLGEGEDHMAEVRDRIEDGPRE